MGQKIAFASVYNFEPTEVLTGIEYYRFMSLNLNIMGWYNICKNLTIG
mgnify:CR=1 FL=1